MLPVATTVWLRVTRCQPTLSNVYVTFLRNDVIRKIKRNEFVQTKDGGVAKELQSNEWLVNKMTTLDVSQKAHQIPSITYNNIRLGFLVRDILAQKGDYGKFPTRFLPQ